MRRILALTTAVALVLAPAAALAQTKIGSLPAGSAVSSTDVFPATQGTCPSSCATNGVSAAQIKTFTSNSPTLITPALGTPASGDASNLTNVPVASAKSGSILPAANGGAGTVNGLLQANGSGLVSAASVTGSGSVVEATSPTLVTPTLGVATVTTIGGAHTITSVTPGASALTGGTAACATSHPCTSLSGEIALTTGTGTGAAGTLFTIVFADTRTNIPNCLVQARSTTGINGNSYHPTPSTTGLVVTADTAAFAASTAYAIDYDCNGN